VNEVIVVAFWLMILAQLVAICWPERRTEEF
jgi:hypothetical protein